MTELERVAADLEDAAMVIEKLAGRVSVLEKVETPWGWWLPEMYETYFCIKSDYTVVSERWENVRYDNKMRNVNNIFRTKQDAELFAPLNKWQRAVAWVLRELNGGWLPDWDNDREQSYYFYFYKYDKVVGVNQENIWQMQHDLLYGKSLDVMNKCLEILGDEIIEKSCGYFR